MPCLEVIKTRDGSCPTSDFTPAKARSWPDVIFFVEDLGIGPTKWKMGQRLADAATWCYCPISITASGIIR